MNPADVPLIDGGLALADLCRVFVDDLCVHASFCGGTPCSLEQCRASTECLGSSSLDAEIAAGWVTYDPNEAAACHNRFAQSPCTFGDLALAIYPSVARALSVCGVEWGTRRAGETCVSPLDCVAGTACSGDGLMCPGTCQATHRGEAGDACVDNHYCRVGLTCLPNSTCGPTSADGGPCNDNDDCCSNLWCEFRRVGSGCAFTLSSATYGVCVPRPTAGQSCGEPPCASGLYCSVAGTCAPFDFSSIPCPGDPCSISNGCTFSRCEAGVCQPLAHLGDPCSADNDCDVSLWVLGTPSVCVGSVCVEPLLCLPP